MPSKWSASIRLPNSDTAPNRQPSSVPAPPGAPMDHFPRLPKPREHLFVERCKCVFGASSSDICRPRCVGGSPFTVFLFAVVSCDIVNPEASRIQIPNSIKNPNSLTQALRSDKSVPSTMLSFRLVFTTVSTKRQSSVGVVWLRYDLFDAMNDSLIGSDRFQRSK